MKEELYATYEEYQGIVKISEQLNDENEQLEKENTKLKQDKQELIEWLEGKINRISGTTSHTYTDSLGKTVMVNRLIQNKYEEVLEKLGGNMKLEVGMIARTNKGLLIDIIHDFDSELCAYKRDEITKASFNLIDLIEVGDILTINQFNNDLEKVEVYETFNIYTKARELCVLSNGKPKRVIEVNIKSMLTHEQYEVNCYKVVE